MILYGMMLGMGCSTQRNTPGTRAYHELTTRYNIYYNAEKAYNEILENQSEDFTEDYTTLLPFYPTAPIQENKVTGGPFDPVVEKTSKAIREHSISTKPRRDPSQPQTQAFRQWLRQEEFNPFIHNAWLLLGKAHLQNGDYDTALAVFMQIKQLFNQDKGLITETEIWLLRTYTEMGRDYDAENMLYALQSKTIPPHLHDFYTETYAARLIHKKEYDAAIPWLKKTIDRERNFRQKKRLEYLLGQIYALHGEKTTAWQAFEDVKGLSTPAEFNRQASLAQLALRDKPTPTEIPDPNEKSGPIEKPDTAEEQDPDKKQDPDTHHFQDYYQAYLKRSSFGAAVTDSVPRPSPHPEMTSPKSAQPPSVIHRPKTMEELKVQLEQKASEALQQNQQTTTNKSREKLLKEREKERKEKIRQREKELRERQRKREATIKQREQQREKQMSRQQRQ
jgi:tetratricopeptide (TPR) repeat protein